MAKKTFYDKVTFTAKVAHDFLRLYNFFGNPSNEPAFQHDYGWYFAFKSADCDSNEIINRYEYQEKFGGE